MTGRYTTGCCTLLSLVLAAVAAAGREFPLKRVIPSGPERSAFSMDAAFLDYTLDPPLDPAKLPAPRCPTPLYARFRLGDEERLLMLDTSGGGVPFYDRLYFDASGDGDLSDEAPLAPVEASPYKGWSPAFLVDGVTVKVKGVSQPYSFAVCVSYRGPRKIPSRVSVKRSLRLAVISNTWYEGTVELGGGNLHLLFGDGNGNGRFDDPPGLPDFSSLQPESTYRAGGDRVLVYEEGKPDAALFQPFGSYLVTGGHTYRISLDTGRGTAAVTEAAEGLAEVTLSMEVERMTLCRATPPLGVVLYRPGKVVHLPPGVYRFDTYRAIRKDEAGSLWAVVAEARVKTPAVEARPGERTGYSLGEPFEVFAQVPSWSIRNVRAGRGGASLDFRIEGAAGEGVVDLARIAGEKSAIPMSEKDKVRPREPSYRVADGKGNTVAEGRFKYG